MNKVLIVEDDEIMNAGLCYSLQKIGLEPVPAGTLEEAQGILVCGKFDLILLDVNLPDGDGFQFAEKIKAQWDTPFIFLTAHNLEDEMIEGFQLGADDYITKPFGIRVVAERVQAVLRRCAGVKVTDVYSCGNLAVDFENHTVKKKGELLLLTPTEYELLQYFCRNRGQILTKDMLLKNIWDNKGNFVNDHALTLNISRLRSKIADEDFQYIKTIYGMGYKWIGGGGE